MKRTVCVEARLLLLAGLLAGLTFPSVALPAEGGIVPGYPENITQFDAREVAMLPKYCPYTQTFREHVPGGNQLEQIHKWEAVLGPTFNAIHHYCLGLMRTNRALFIARTVQYKKHYLQTSIEEFDYVLRSATPDFVLLPEILTKKGENLIRLGRAADGIAQLLKAAEIKPDYWPPYAVISDYYKSKGETAKARDALQRGLSAAPDASPLKSRLAQLAAPAAKD